MKNEIETITAEIAQLEGKRETLRAEIEAAQFRVKMAQDAVIENPTHDARHDLLTAQAEAGALETATTEITRRRDFLGRQLKKAREDEQREQVEREVIARSERLFADDAKNGEEEENATLADISALYRRRVAQGEELESLQNFAAQNGVNSHDFPAFASLKSDSPAAIMARSIENLVGATGYEKAVEMIFSIEQRKIYSEKDKIWQANWEAQKAKSAAKVAESHAAQAEAQKRNDEENRARYMRGDRDALAQTANLKWEKEQRAISGSTSSVQEEINPVEQEAQARTRAQQVAARAAVFGRAA